MHLTKIENQKKTFEKRERKGIKTLIVIIPFPIAFEFKRVSKLTNHGDGWMVLSTSFQIYKFYKFWSWEETPINCFIKCSINRHYHAYNKNTNKRY